MRHINYKPFDKATSERWDLVSKKRTAELFLNNPSFWGRGECEIDWDFIGKDFKTEQFCKGDIKIINRREGTELVIEAEVREDFNNYDKIVSSKFDTIHVPARKEQERGFFDAYIGFHADMNHFYLISSQDVLSSKIVTRMTKKPGGERGPDDFFDVYREYAALYTVDEDCKIITVRPGLWHSDMKDLWVPSRTYATV